MSLAAYSTYESYKDSDTDWIDQIPTHWEIKRAGFLLDEVNLRSSDGLEPLLSLSKTKGVVRRDSMAERGGQAESLVGYKRVSEGDIVVNRMQASNGLISVSSISGITSPDYGIYRTKGHEEIRSDIVAKLLQQPEYQGEIKRRVKGVMEGFIRLYSDDLFRLPLICAPLWEQHAIASFLDEKSEKIDEAVRIKKAQIELLRERRQILIQEAVTRGLNPDAPMKDSGIDWIGQIPAHWEVSPLRSLFSFRNEKNDPIKTENILSLSIAHGVTQYSDEKRGGNKRKDDITAYKLARPDDIVLNSMNVIVGAVGRSRYFGAISPVYYALFLRSKSQEIGYFEYMFAISSFQRGLLRYGKGILMKLSGTGQLNTIRMKISPNSLKVLPLPVPTVAEQRQIIDFLQTETQKIDAAITLKQDQIAALKEYKTGLINAAVTGKIKVI